ncbi:signal transduction protein [Candidatus Scalindua japonica]|uniref:Signal transduction protein n=1 Tax=Candidatus Scalindua japonica TaxID=1284222 RepID=A0A286TWH1_9BACT|nr:response regulator [Candidatus Scalindua japonica]GAX60222.1 signal transduction protein [Candidatus Scalindua japonica]
MIRRILFVDNNSNTSREFKETLSSVCREWMVESVVNGNAAMNIMSDTQFDAVISDILIPGMDGVKLLDFVNDRYPDTVRIIHSTFTEPEIVLKSKNTVHQFLMKPCSVETMKNTIERTCILRDLLGNEILKKTIARIRTLPSLPVLYNLIVEEMHAPEPSLKKVGDLISQDISMSAKILQLVNSALFGLPQKITSPQQAVVYVGIETLKSLVLSFHVFSSLEDDADSCGFSLLKMWKHSLKTSRLAKDIARAEKSDRKAAEEAMIAGMLHDIGKLVLLKLPVRYNEVMSLVETTGCSHSEAEYTVMKTSHAELGAYLLGLWGLSGSIVETVTFHHNPSKLINNMFETQKDVSKEESSETKTEDINSNSGSIEQYTSGFATLTAVHVANALAMQENCTSETTSFPEIDMPYLKKLGLAEKLPEWVGLYKKTMQLSEAKFG